MQAALPEDSRNIAVTYYQLGIALGFNMKYEDAIEKLEMAIGVLKKRIDNLINKTESVDESKKDDAFYTREKEIKEIEALIPEIKEKITDTIEMKEESMRKIAEVKEQMGFGSGKGDLLFRCLALRPVQFSLFIRFIFFWSWNLW